MHEREVYEGSDGRVAKVSWLRLRKEWSVAIRDAHGIYGQIGFYRTHEEAVEALRGVGEWQGLPPS